MRVQIVFQSFRHLAYIFVPVCWRIVGTMIAFCRHSLIGTYCVVNFIQQLSSPYSPRYRFCGTLLALRYTGDLETCKTDAVEYTYMRARREFRDRPDVEVAVLKSAQLSKLILTRLKMRLQRSNQMILFGLTMAMIASLYVLQIASFLTRTRRLTQTRASSTRFVRDLDCDFPCEWI